MDSTIVTLQEETYWDHVKNNDCLIVFHKPKCPNCKVLLKVLDKCKVSHPEIEMACINSEDNQAVLKELDLTRVPSVLVYKNGEILAQKSGIMKPVELAALYLNV